MADQQTPTTSTFASRRAARLGAQDKTVHSGDAETKTAGDDGDAQGEDASSSSEEGPAEDLNSLTVAQLQARAGEEGIEGRSSMSKAELVDALAQRQ